MKKLHELYGIYLPIFLLILPATVALRTIAIFTELAEYGHFDNPLLSNISGWAAAIASLFFLTYMFVGKKDIKLIPSFDSAANYVPSGLVAVATALLGGHLISKALSTDFTSLSLYGRVIAIATPILAFVSVVYFVLASVMIARRSMRRSDFGIITLLFICMYVAYLYFDTTLPINAPTRLADEVAYLSIAMFFLGETRLSLGRESWRKYISFAFIGALLTAYSAIPNLIYYFAREKAISLSIYESLLTLAFFIFIICKIFLTPTLTKDKTSDVVAKIIAAAEARAEELKPEEVEDEVVEDTENEDDSDENQIAITYEDAEEYVTEFVALDDEKEEPIE